MGMFDSLYKGAEEWQTKAYDCALDRYNVGDVMPTHLGRYYGDVTTEAPDDYQVEVLGGRRPCRDSLATVRGGVLASIDDPRDPLIPLVDYSGGIVRPSEV